MERIVGIKAIRPKLGEYLKQVEEGEVIVLTSRSEPKGVLLGYDAYNELKTMAQKAKQFELAQIINNFRDRAEEAGLTEEDVFREIEWKYGNESGNRHKCFNFRFYK